MEDGQSFKRIWDAIKEVDHPTNEMQTAPSSHCVTVGNASYMN